MSSQWYLHNTRKTLIGSSEKASFMKRVLLIMNAIWTNSICWMILVFKYWRDTPNNEHVLFSAFLIWFLGLLFEWGKDRFSIWRWLLVYILHVVYTRCVHFIQSNKIDPWLKVKCFAFADNMLVQRGRQV